MFLMAKTITQYKMISDVKYTDRNPGKKLWL